MGFGKNYLNLESEIIAIKTVEQLIFLKVESTLISNNKNSPFPKISYESIYEADFFLKNKF